MLSAVRLASHNKSSLLGGSQQPLQPATGINTGMAGRISALNRPPKQGPTVREPHATPPAAISTGVTLEQRELIPVYIQRAWANISTQTAATHRMDQPENRIAPAQQPAQSQGGVAARKDPLLSPQSLPRQPFPGEQHDSATQTRPGDDRFGSN